MSGLILSQKGQEKLNLCLKKYRFSSFQVAGFYLAEEKYIAEKIPAAGGQKSSGAPGIGASMPAWQKVQWNGISGFVVPPNCVDFYCTAADTYGQVLSRFIRETGTSLKDKGTPTVLAVCFPEHRLWQNCKQWQLQQFLDDCFAEFRIIPVFMRISELETRKNQLIVNVDRNWTTFTLWDKNGQISHQTSVSFGTGCSSPMVRLNDYLHNSTASWEEIDFTGSRGFQWEWVFSRICGDLASDGWPAAADALVICEDDFEADIRKCLKNSKLASSNIVHIQNPAAVIAEFARQELSKMVPHNKEEKKSGEPITPIKKNDPLFDW